MYYIMGVWKFDKDFVKLLLRNTVDPTLVTDIENCTWDQDVKNTVHTQGHRSRRSKEHSIGGVLQQ